MIPRSERSVHTSLSGESADGDLTDDGGVRYISDLDAYEASPVLHGANRWAGQLGRQALGAVLTVPARCDHPASDFRFSFSGIIEAGGRGAPT